MFHFNSTREDKKLNVNDKKFKEKNIKQFERHGGVKIK